MSNDVGRRFYLGYVLMEVTGAGAFDQWVAVREVDTGKTTQRTVTEVRRLIAKHDNDPSLVLSRGQVVASALKAHPEMSEQALAALIDVQIEAALRWPMEGARLLKEHQRQLKGALVRDDVERWLQKEPK